MEMVLVTMRMSIIGGGRFCILRGTFIMHCDTTSPDLLDSMMYHSHMKKLQVSRRFFAKKQPIRKMSDNRVIEKSFFLNHMSFRVTNMLVAIKHISKGVATGMQRRSDIKSSSCLNCTG
jgi:hypothetical protein